MLPALLPSLSSRFDLDAPALALLVGAFAISTSVPQPLFGLVADRSGARRVAAAGLAVSALLVAGLGWVSSTAALAAVLVLGGLGSSAVHPAGMGLARTTAARSPGLALALFSSAGMAGAALGPLFAVGVSSAWGFSALAWAAIPALVVAVCLARGVPKPVAAAEQPSPMSVVRRMSEGPVAWLVVVALLANIVMLTFTSALPIWLVNERGLSETSPVMAGSLATFSLAAAAGGLLGGSLARSFRAERLIVGSLASSVVALEAVLVTAPGTATYFAAVAASGALLGLHSPLLITRAQELTPGGESAVAGVLLGATTGAAGLVYAGIGALQATFGVATTLAVTALLVLPAAQLAALVLRPAAEARSSASAAARVAAPSRLLRLAAPAVCSGGCC